MGKFKRRVIHFVVMLIVIGLGVAGFLALTASKPQLKRTKPPVPVPMVRVTKIQIGTKTITIQGEGTVRPLREIELVPQVGGKVVSVSPIMVDGGEFQKGDTLLRIDPLDYELAVTLARARVKDSESRLKVAEEEAASAKEEWQLLYQNNREVEKEPPALVAKEPQLAAARARLSPCRVCPRQCKIDRLADEGAIFTDYYGEQSCTAGRSAFITGQHPVRTGLTKVGFPGSAIGIQKEDPTLAELLKNHGYATGQFGKNHLGDRDEHLPTNHGFDEFFGFLTGGHQYFPELWTLDDISGVDSQFAAYKTKLLRNDTRIDEKEYLTDALSREAVRFIQGATAKDQPFFLYLAYNAPHTPWQVPDKWFDKYARDADLLVHECFIAVPDLIAKLNLTPEAALQVGTQIHTAPEAFGKVMSMVKPRHAIAYHFFYDHDTVPGILRRMAPSITRGRAQPGTPPPP